MASATDQTTEFKDHQETMFEDSTSFAIPEEDSSQEVPESLDPSHDSLPDEAPDTVHNQVLFPEATDFEPTPEPPPVQVGSHQGTNPLPRAQFTPAPSASETPVMAGEEFMPRPVAAMPMAPPPPAEEVSPSQPDAQAGPEAGPAAGLAPEAAPEPPAVALSMDDFAALEERVLRAVTLVRREREARLAAEERLMHMESQVLAQAPVLENVQHLQQEVDSLRAERDQVRQRVERLLGQLDALEL
jgi:hypothetical protein